MKLHNVETLNMIPSSFILLHSQAHEIITGPICYHGTCFNWWYESSLYTSNFKYFSSNFPVKIQKTGDTYPMAYGRFRSGIWKMVYANFSSNLPTGLHNFEFVDLTIMYITLVGSGLWAGHPSGNFHGGVRYWWHAGGMFRQYPCRQARTEVGPLHRLHHRRRRWM